QVANPIGDAPKRVPVSQHSAPRRLLTSGAPARVLCPANFAQRVPAQPQKSVLSTQKLSNNQTAQQPRPKLPQQAIVRPQVASKSSEKPPQAAAPEKNPEAESTSKQKTEETAKKKTEETKS
ncbi:AURKA kinase, partial [Thryothorus ludovicianus]|nr:AURKA kinase [Thryothorus ludovicianus]